MTGRLLELIAMQQVQGEDNKAKIREGVAEALIHGKVDALGMPLGFIITAGQNSDVGWGEALLGDECCSFLLTGREDRRS